MSFASRLSKLSRPADMEGDEESSEQVEQMQEPNSASPQSSTDGGAASSGQPDTSSYATSSPQLARVPGNAQVSGTRHGVGSPSGRPVVARGHMSFGQRVGERDSVQTSTAAPAKAHDLTHLHKPAKVNKGAH